MNITCVSVTYARRWHLLRQSLASAFRGGVVSAIVVDNGSHEPVAELAGHEFGDKVKVITLATNTGSANGFKVGLEAALAAGAEFIMLLDDDNVLESGALAVLKQGWQEIVRYTPAEDLSVLAFRPEHQPATETDCQRVGAYQDSFFDFHLYDLPFKLWQRTPWFKAHRNSAQPEHVRVRVAPYGGMFFHRVMLEKHGVPNPEFVLYADDTEFSYRLTRAGGGVWLFSKAHITDLESSWSESNNIRSSFQVLLKGEGDFRAYYLVRNVAYFESYCRPHRNWMRAINRVAYLIILTSVALRLGNLTRLKLLLRAIKDGERGKLGINKSFPLS